MESTEIKTSSQLTSKEIGELEDQAIYGKTECIILARKGSRRLKNKHKLVLNGKPLIMYAIQAAKDSNLFDGIMVSSDDEGILEMAYEARIQPHQRGKELAGDKVQMRHVVKYLIEQFDFGKCGCLLGACNPFTTADDLKAGQELFRQKDANYVMSVKLARPHPETALVLKKGTIIPKLGTKRTQGYEPMYYHDGGFIFFKPEAFWREFDYGFYGSKNYPYITPHQSVDIDTQEDFDYAQFLMEGKENRKNFS